MYGLGHIAGGQAPGLGRHRVHHHVDLPHRPAVHRGAGHPGDPLHDGLDVVEGVIVEPGPRKAAAIDGHLDHGRVGRVVLEHEGGQYPQGLGHGGHGEGHLLLHQSLGSIEVRAPFEPDVDDAETIPRLALHVVHTGRGTDVLLHPPGDRLFDVRGA